MVPDIEGDLRDALVRALIDATDRANAASKAFTEVMGDIPSGMPHPDGVQRIRNAAHDLSAARAELMKAHTRLNEFFSSGISRGDLS